ncbi:MAG: EAL domain-containing protein [Actinobacteria bacterium]|nr:EAL domain-containing protein [Actinomycetota bacterium]MCA1721356.1 EAL domain-containing protein [Actinomycetota bacterium]
MSIPAPRPAAPGSDTFGIALQPIVDLQRGEVVGYEALARFGGSRNRLPGPWLARARDAGDLQTLEAVLLRAALDTRTSLPAGLFVAVNVSPQLLASPKVRAVLRGAGDLSNVVLECTEHVEFGDLGALRREVASLRSRGLRLALDDVGAGWSGLRQIAELGPDIVKVDRSLVTDVDRDPVKGALLELLVAFTGRLGGLLLVEGVERYEELDYAARLGVALAQGYVLGRPSLRPHSPDDDLLTRVKFRAGTQRHTRQVVAHLDVTAPVVHVGEAVRYPSTGAPGRHTVLVDDQEQPTHLYRAGEGAGRLARISTVQAGDASTAALRMAMTRAGATRFDPLACVDRAGRFLGLIAVEDLVRAVLADAEAAD